MHISLSTRSGGLVRAVGLVCLLAGAAGLQAQTNTGGIRGSVFDETMGAVPGATVRTVEENRGVERQSLTSETGEFAFTYLDPGVYSLSIEAEGFAPLTIEGLEVRVGENATVSPQLALAATEELVVVTAESARSAIEPERVQQSDHIDSVRIQNLPINRRDYLDLALLTPAVVDASYVANATDRRIAATPTSGLGIGGTNGRGNTFMIDGLDNGFNTGAVRSTISQEAVQEFQVNRNSFSTEQGGAPGRSGQYRHEERHERAPRIPVRCPAEPQIPGPQPLRSRKRRLYKSAERRIRRGADQAQQDLPVLGVRAPGPPRIANRPSAGRQVVPHFPARVAAAAG